MSGQSDTASLKRDLARDKKETVNQVLRESRNLKRMVLEMHPKMVKLDLERVKSLYFTEREERLKNKLEDMEGSLDEVR